MEPTSYPRLPPSKKCSFEGGSLEGRAIGGCTFTPRGKQPSKAKLRHPWVPKLRCVGLLAPGFEVHPAMARVGPGLQQLTWPDVLPVRSSLRGLLLRSETPSRIVWNPGWPPGWACPAFVLSGVGVNYWFFGRSRRQRALELLRCPVVSDMLADIGNGSSHVQSCVKHCRNMVKAGLAKPGSPASVLAEVGDASFNNVERDLHVLMRAVYPVEPYIVPVTLYNDQGDIPATKPRAVKMRRAPQIWIRSSPDLGRIGPGQFPD